MILCGREKTQKDTFMLKTLLEMFKRKEFDQHHSLQRNAGCWKSDGESGLITTALRKEDVDPIKICEQIFDDDYKLWLIDGLQRLMISAY